MSGCFFLNTVYIAMDRVSGSTPRLVVPRHHRSKFGRQVFSVACPMWNSLSNFLRDIDSFRSALNTCLFAVQRDTYSAFEAWRNAILLLLLPLLRLLYCQRKGNEYQKEWFMVCDEKDVCGLGRVIG